MDMGSNSNLLAIESISEYEWILSMMSTVFPTIAGFYVDATRGR